MTVGELIESLKTLPQDMEIMVINEDRQDPVDITLVSRGSWTDDVEPDGHAYRDHDPEFIQDDENGTVAVLVTW
jgi:hypothetical protein